LIAERDLDAAGIDGPGLRAGYLACRRLNLVHGRTYFLATLLLPPHKRPYVHALYGFARHVDDIVDDTVDDTVDRGGDARRAERFDRWVEQFHSDLYWESSSDPINRAVIDTIRRWQIPQTYVADFLGSMRMDLTVTEYETFDDLAGYMWGSAAVIGLQMLPILGRADDSIAWETLEPYAADLGMAFQLTNFIRDVAEDLRRGRIYLPQESLRRFGVDRERLSRGITDEPIRNLIAWEIERARGLYRSAAPGIELVHPTSVPCLRTAATLYAGILDEIEARDYDVLSRRVIVPRRRRATVGVTGLVQALATRRGAPSTPTSPT
jgi:phytoene synthase